MDRHYLHWRGVAPTLLAQTLLRLAGGAALTLALACCARTWGGPIGLVAWMGFFAAGALCWIMLWACARRMALWALPLAGLIAVVSL